MVDKLSKWLTEKLKPSQKCPECSATPPGFSPTKPSGNFFIKKEHITDRLFTVECPNCGHNFTAYVCRYCNSVYYKLSIFQRTNFSSSSVKAYECLCSNSTLKVKQDHRSH